jgi:hypothetical protein
VGGERTKGGLRQARKEEKPENWLLVSGEQERKLFFFICTGFLIYPPISLNSLLGGAVSDQGEVLRRFVDLRLFLRVAGEVGRAPTDGDGRRGHCQVRT